MDNELQRLRIQLTIAKACLAYCAQFVTSTKEPAKSMARECDISLKSIEALYEQIPDKTHSEEKK